MSAWADYVDGRRQVIHQWKNEGASTEEILVRLELDAELVEQCLRAEATPFPGSSRWQLNAWRARCAALEAEVHAAGAVPSEPPKESGFHALALHPDPECCGCQYWTDHPRPGQHHPRCEHARPA